MSQGNRDGVEIDQSVLIIDEKKSGFPKSVRIFQLFAIVIGSWSAISIFLESFLVPVNVIYINTAVIITTVIVFGLCLITSFDVIKQFFGALFYVLYFISRLPRIKNGFYILENLVLVKMGSYYGYQSMRYKANYSTAPEDSTILIIMALIPLVALLTVAIVRNKYVMLCSLILLVPVSSCFIFGMIPSERYLVAFVISMVYMTRSGYSAQRAINKEQETMLHRINSSAAIWLSLMGVILFLLVKFVVTPDEYDGITKIKEIKTEVQTAMFNFSLQDISKGFTDIRFPNKNVSIGGLSGGKLGRTGQVKYNNTEHLRVKAPLSSIEEGVYLKGYVGSVYTGDKWEGHSKDAIMKYQILLKNMPVVEFPSVNQVNLLLYHILGKINNSKVTFTNENGSPSLSEYTIFESEMKIEYKAANKKYLYAPYFTNYELLGEADYQQDLYSVPTLKNDYYEFNYYYNISLGASPLQYYYDLPGKLGNYSEYEKLYREYVYQVYTKLPEEGLDRLKQDFSTETIKVISNSIPEQIEYVKNYLHQNTQYSLSPGKLPKGKDFVAYFLYENKVGYCSHYASAATLILRSMGIPARYVEGYAAGISDVIKRSTDKTQNINYYSDNTNMVIEEEQVEISVKDYNAHAWVEVYIDNCGWIPVEFTPGSAVEYNCTVMEDMAQLGGNLRQFEEEQIVSTKEPEETTQGEENTKEPVDETEKEDTGTTEDNATKEQVKRMIVLFLVLFAIITASFGLMYLVQRVWNKSRAKHTRNHNKKALFLFTEIEKILATCHGLPRKGVRLEDCEEYVRDHCQYIEHGIFAGCMETVRKARFGRGSITSKELREVELFHQSLYDEVYNELPLGKRIYLKFILSV